MGDSDAYFLHLGLRGFPVRHDRDLWHGLPEEHISVLGKRPGSFIQSNGFHVGVWHTKAAGKKGTAQEDFQGGKNVFDQVGMWKHG